MTEELRLLYKELGWIRQHIKNIHDLLAAEPISEDDPNQLSLFPEEQPQNE